MAIMLYALYTYHWRAASIRRGGRGPYDDRVGPVRHPLLQRRHYSCEFTDRVVYCPTRCAICRLLYLYSNVCTVAVVLNFILRFAEPAN